MEKMGGKANASSRYQRPVPLPGTRRKSKRFPPFSNMIQQSRITKKKQGEGWPGKCPTSRLNRAPKDWGVEKGEGNQLALEWVSRKGRKKREKTKCVQRKAPVGGWLP